MTERPLTLTELLSEVRQCIKSTFADYYWVIAEIAEAKEHHRGHCYLTLVDRQQEGLTAQIKANIWAYEYRRLIQKFRSATGEGFKVGMKVMLLVAVDCHEVYGMSLNIKDVEPSYTLGEMALKRKEIIERLKAEGLIDRNKSLPLPLAPQKIAVVSSSQAAGFGDFINQLTQNPYGYCFSVRLFEALLQGDLAEASIINALNEVRSLQDNFDVVVIIRGGGSSVDLSCFDSYDLAVAVANFPLPVFTGIGHEKDDTIVDMVAHTRLKTPTAVAEFLISGLRFFEDTLMELHQRLKSVTIRCLRAEQLRLDSLSNRFVYASNNFISNNKNRLAMLHLKLFAGYRAFMTKQQSLLDSLNQAIRLLSPESVLRRGYSITTYKGKAIKQPSDLKDGAEITTILKDFSFVSIYKDKKKEVSKVARARGVDLFTGLE